MHIDTRINMDPESPSEDDARKKWDSFKNKKFRSVKECSQRNGKNTMYSDGLLKAVDEDDYKKCEKLLENERDVTDENSMTTALHIAAKRGYDNILRLLLDKGVDCNAQDNTNQTPLHLAVTKGNFNCCTQLLKCPDLNVNAYDEHGDTALHLAVKGEQYRICDEILNHRYVEVNTKNKKGMTPLHFAAQKGHGSELQLLTERGANWKLPDNKHYLPIHYAAHGGFDKCCEALLSLDSNADDKQKQLKATIKDGKTPIILAAECGHNRCCKTLGGTNINAKDKEGNSALFHAAHGCFENTVSALLELGADPNIQNKCQIAPVHEASKKHWSGSLQILIENGADWNLRGKQNRTVVHFAAEANTTECLKYLLMKCNARSLLNVQDNKDHTPLHLAIKCNREECAKYLVENGASAGEQCVKGMTALHLAAERGYRELCVMLLERHEVQVSKIDKKKQTPLHFAALRGSVVVCQILLQKGASLTAADENGQTALHVASSNGHTDVVKLLIKRGTLQNTKDDTGSTALHLAASEGKLECCDVLGAGAKSISRVDHNGDLPLDRAFRNEHDEVFRFLMLQLSFSEQQEERMKRLHDYMQTALEQNRIIAAEAIIDSTWWKIGLRGKTDHQSQNFRTLVEKYPNLALRVQNKCIQRTGIQVAYDFRDIEDNYHIPSDQIRNLYDPETGELDEKASKFTEDGLLWKKKHPLTLMIHHNRPQLLKHPLINVWLIQKGRAYMSKLFLALLVLEIIFNGCIFAFMGRTENWSHINSIYGLEKDQFCQMTMARTSPEFHLINATRFMKDASVTLQLDSEDSYTHLLINETFYKSVNEKAREKHITWAALVTVTFFVLLLEFNSMFRLRDEYIRGSSLLQICRTILILVILIPFSTCNYHYMVLDVLQWQAGIITLLCSWLLLINTLNHLPILSVFMPVTSTFLKGFISILLYIFMLIFAFGFIFHLLLPNQPAFSTVDQAMIKTIVWMLGDLAYDDTFLSDDPNMKLLYPVMGNILFVVFVTVIGGFIVNLIITQPSDTLDRYRDRASFHIAANRVDLFLRLDVCFPFFQKRTVGIFADHGETQITCGLTKKLLSLSKDPREEEAAEPQIHKALETQLEDQKALLAELKAEIRDLKQQLDFISKSLPGST